MNFGNAQLGDRRRTKRLVAVANAIARHPGGSLPDKLRSPAQLEALYHLMKSQAVTHASLLAPHCELTLARMAQRDGPLLVIHDTTELDFTTHRSLEGQGQIGNGSRTGWLCHNSLAFDPQRQDVLGLTGQILHRRVLHRRAKVRKNESQAARRQRTDRESRLWLQVTQTLRGGREHRRCLRPRRGHVRVSGTRVSQRSVVRSSYNRSIRCGHGEDAARDLLHTFARTLRSVGEYTMTVRPQRLEQKPQKQGPKKIVQRKGREAVLCVAAAPILLRAPLSENGNTSKNGEHGNDPLPLWIVRVWEADPPAGEAPLEWFLLTNHPGGTFADARQVVAWYEFRWVIEEYHKAKKTGCGIENPQFTSPDRLQPMIALLSVVAITLLNLRELSRRPDARQRPASGGVSTEIVKVLSAWRHGSEQSEWSIHDFCFALARLGGHQNRQHDSPPRLARPLARLDPPPSHARRNPRTQKTDKMCLNLKARLPPSRKRTARVVEPRSECGRSTPARPLVDDRRRPLTSRLSGSLALPKRRPDHRGNLSRQKKSPTEYQHDLGRTDIPSCISDVGMARIGRLKEEDQWLDDMNSLMRSGKRSRICCPAKLVIPDGRRSTTACSLTQSCSC